MAHIDVRDLGRIRAISGVLARYGFGSLLGAVGIDDAPEETEEAAAVAHWAVRLRQVLVELGPTFVKLGQVLSVRPDIIPPALIEEFRKLQDKVPAVDWEGIHGVLEAELHQPIEQVFASVEQRPVASASIAQVHLATLADGQEVAIKVQRPGIHEVIRSDLHILYTLAHLAEGRLEVPGLYTPVAIVQEFEQALLQELDFLQEARAAERFRRDFLEIEGVMVPRVFTRHSTSRLMVMERVEGTPLSALDANDARVPPLMQRLVDASIRQVFDHGFFHADPHPGNLLLLDDGRLAFLDFGLCGTLTAEMRDVLVTVLASLVFQDAETLALTIYRVGGVEGQVDLRAFRSDIERMMQKYHGATLSDLSATASLVEFIEVASRFQIRLVPEYALLARTASIVDGILRGMVPELDPVQLVRPHVTRLVSQRLSPDRMAADALRLFAQAQGGLRGLPIQLNQLLMDMERGSLTLRTLDPDAPENRSELRLAAFRLSLSLCAMATLLSGAMMLASWDPRPWGVPIVGLAGLAIVSTAVAMWVGLVIHTLFGGQLSIQRWRRRAMTVARFFLGDRRP